MDERTLTIVLRLIHILGGIFWVGAMILLAGFLLPTVRATGREGGRFMQTLMQQQRLQFYLGLAAALTVLSGITMYARLAAATHGAWAGSRPGIAYGVGAAAAILAAAFGGGISGSAGRKMLALGQAIGSAPPSVEQQAELSRLQRRMALGARVAASFLVIAASAMAVGRYL
ncbi:MAG TPA: hypothetical protein VKB22_12675 [Gemmatimonadales bacterium]|jgi:hypothetical protein|nr:hypothetical protein [Gemmatimonadales bacterium]